jgi:hypothetical protein
LKLSCKIDLVRAEFTARTFVDLIGGRHGQESEEGEEDKEGRQEKEITLPTSAIPTARCAMIALE